MHDIKYFTLYFILTTDQKVGSSTLSGCTLIISGLQRNIGSTSKIGDEAFISGLGFWVWGGWVFSRTER